ncbi:hypothetical protein BaRGS_00003851 [Batillaria attramentaria]|uniref:Uncharacterized protein n=1 Tax=Batillaria attramentaria TaxID=370345 RepID=A0ABD0M0C1_9CAEN
MPTTPSVTGRHIEDTCVTSLHTTSQAVSTSLVAEKCLKMQGSRAEQDAGGDSYEHKSSAAVEKDVKTPKNTGQTSPQGRRLKAPGNVVLDKSDVRYGRDGFKDYARQRIRSADKPSSDSSHQKQPRELPRDESAEPSPDVAASRTMSLQGENIPQHLGESGSKTNLDDASFCFNKKKRDDCADDSNTPVLIPVLKTRSHKVKSREGVLERKVSVTEPVPEETACGSNTNNNNSSSARAKSEVDSEGSRSRTQESQDNNNGGSSKTAGSSFGGPATKRRISFPADSVLTAVIQDGDTPELLRILSGRHGPGLVQCQQVDVCQANHVGLTALHHAVLANNLDAAKLLLCHGADANAQDVHGFSPLHTAAACGSLPITTLLVLFGADVFALTHENEMPVDVAKDLGIVRVLSTEMTRLIHRELWLTAVVRARADDAWLLLRKVLAYVLLFFLHLVSLIRKNVVSQRDHKKSD